MADRDPVQEGIKAKRLDVSVEEPFIFGAVALDLGPIYATITENNIIEQTAGFAGSPSYKMTGDRTVMASLTFLFDETRLNPCMIECQGVELRADINALFGMLNITPYVPIYHSGFNAMVGHAAPSEVQYFAIDSVKMSSNEEMPNVIRVDLVCTLTNLSYVCGGGVSFPDVIVNDSGEERIKSVAYKMYKSAYIRNLVNEKSEEIRVGGNKDQFSMKVNTKSSLEEARFYAFKVLNLLQVSAQERQALEKDISISLSTNIYNDDTDLPYASSDITTPYISHIEAGYDNVFSSKQILGQSLPFHQFGGRYMSNAKVRLVLKNIDDIKSIREFQYYIQDLTQRIRLLRGVIPIKVDNYIFKLLGFENCILTDISLSSIPEYPGAFVASLSFIDNTKIKEKELITAVFGQSTNEMFDILFSNIDIGEKMENDGYFEADALVEIDEQNEMKYAKYHPLILTAYYELMTTYYINLTMQQKIAGLLKSELKKIIEKIYGLCESLNLDRDNLTQNDYAMLSMSFNSQYLDSENHFFGYDMSMISYAFNIVAGCFASGETESTKSDVDNFYNYISDNNPKIIELFFGIGKALFANGAYGTTLSDSHFERAYINQILGVEDQIAQLNAYILSSKINTFIDGMEYIFDNITTRGSQFDIEDLALAEYLKLRIKRQPGERLNYVYDYFSTLQKYSRNDWDISPKNVFQHFLILSLMSDTESLNRGAYYISNFQSSVCDALTYASFADDPNLAGTMFSDLLQNISETEKSLRFGMGLYENIDKIYMSSNISSTELIVSLYDQASDYVAELTDENASINDGGDPPDEYELPSYSGSNNIFLKNLLTSDLKKLAKEKAYKDTISGVKQITNIHSIKKDLLELVSGSSIEGEGADDTLIEEEIVTILSKVMKGNERFLEIVGGGDKKEGEKHIDSLVNNGQINSLVQTFRNCKDQFPGMVGEFNEKFTERIFKNNSEVNPEMSAENSENSGTTQDILKLKIDNEDFMQYALEESFYNMLDLVPASRLMLPNTAVFFMVQKFGVEISVVNMFSYHAVLSCEIRKSKESPMDVATLQLSNNSGVFNDVPPSLEEALRKSKSTDDETEESSWGNDILAVTTGTTKNMVSLFIRTGTAIQIRMGYGTKASGYHMVFQGVISDLKIGETVDIVASSYGIDLLKPSYKKDKKLGVWYSLNPRDMVTDAVTSTKSAAFGMGTSFLQALSKDENLLKGLPDSLTSEDSLYIAAERATLIATNIYHPDKYWQPITEYAEDDKDYVFGLRKIDQQNNEQLYMNYIAYNGSSAWDVIYDAVLRSPGFIAQVENMGNGLVTLFFGKPDWPYRYLPSYAVFNELAMYNTLKSAINASFTEEYNRSIENIYEKVKEFFGEIDIADLTSDDSVLYGAIPIQDLKFITESIIKGTTDKNPSTYQLLFNNIVNFTTNIPGHSLYTTDNALNALPLSAQKLTNFEYVVDGDTYRYLFNGKEQRVRLVGYNSPEVGEDYYEEAKQCLAEIFKDKDNIYIDFLKTSQGEYLEDQYSRQLAVAYLKVGDKYYNINTIMLSMGMGKLYLFNNIPVSLQQTFTESSKYAENKKQGIYKNKDRDPFPTFVSNLKTSGGTFFVKKSGEADGYWLYFKTNDNVIYDLSEYYNTDTGQMIIDFKSDEESYKKKIVISKKNMILEFERFIGKLGDTIKKIDKLIEKQNDDFTKQINLLRDCEGYMTGDKTTKIGRTYYNDAQKNLNVLKSNNVICQSNASTLGTVINYIVDYFSDQFELGITSEDEYYYGKAAVLQDFLITYDGSLDNIPCIEELNTLASELAYYIRNNLSNAAQNTKILMKLSHLQRTIKRENSREPDIVLAAKRTTLPGFKPFRQYWVAHSNINLLSNTVITSTANMWNQVTMISKDLHYGISAWRFLEKFSIWIYDMLASQNAGEIVNVDGDKYRVYTTKFDDDIDDRDIIDKVVTQNQGLNMQSRAIIGSSLLAEGIAKMYGGMIEIVGNPRIKQNDVIFISDDSTGMYGMVVAASVTHSFTPNGGFVTYIEPEALVEVRDVHTNGFHSLCAVLVNIASYLVSFAIMFASAALSVASFGMSFVVGALLAPSISNIFNNWIGGNYNAYSNKEVLSDGTTGTSVITMKEAFNTVTVRPVTLRGLPYTSGLRGTEYDNISSFGAYRAKLCKQFWDDIANNFRTYNENLSDAMDYGVKMRDIDNLGYYLESLYKDITDETGKINPGNV